MNDRIASLCCCFSLFASLVNGDTPASAQRDGADMRKAEVFDIAGHRAFLYPAPQLAAGKPWVWYAPVVKGDFILARHPAYFDAFLQAGVTIAGYDLGEVRGSPASTARFTSFYDAMVQRGYSPKPILLGQSRGGLMTLAWAVRNPGKVRAWAGIYPVCNLASYPLKSSKQTTLADFAMSEDDLRSKFAELNPIENLAALAAHKVPIFAVHGDNDGLVPLDENTRLLHARYEAAGGISTIKIIPGGRHEVSPAFFECAELVDFILGQARLR
jgi:fermentation-respiration switch protein FrsA (DUF1100 family)